MNIRIKSLWLSILVGLTITSCNQETKKNKDSLTVNKFLSDDASTLNYVETLAEIEEDLEIIKEKNGVIELSSKIGKEGKIINKDDVLRNIAMINSIMDENRAKIEELNNRLENSNNINMDLILLSKMTNDKISEQENTLDDLKTKLNRKSFRLEDLNERMSIVSLENAKMNDLIAELKSKANSGYYAVGPYKLLKEKEIVEKEGGIIGIGAVKTIDEDFSQEDFNEIDISKVTKVNVDSKKAKLLTVHPTDSYKFKTKNDKVDYLEILKPDEFWKASKYLIVETK